MTSLPRWALLLQATLRQLSEQHTGASDLRVAIVGIGNVLRGDDGAGPAVADALQFRPDAQILVINAGPAPENMTGPLRRFKPDLVVLVDMAQMNLPAGSVQWIPWQTASGLSASSHTMPLHVLVRYLVETTGCEAVLLGIQPAQTGLDVPLSPPVATAVTDIATILSRLLADRATLPSA